MAIAPSDLQTRYSGGSANTSASGSLGGVMSNTPFSDNVLNNLWDDVTGAESASGDIEYRAFYIRNGHGSLTWSNVVYWISSLTTSNSTEFDIGKAQEGVGVSIAQTLPDQNASTGVPTGVTFTRPQTKGTGIALGSIPAQSFQGVWIRRTVDAGAAAASDSGTIAFDGDTPA